MARAAGADVLTATAAPTEAKAVAINASTSAARRQRRLNSARVSILAPWAASAPTPSESTAVLGAPTVTSAWASWHQVAGRQAGCEEVDEPQHCPDPAQADALRRC